MLVLVVDTSTPTVLAAVVTLDAEGTAHTRAVRETVDARAHAEVLTPQVLQCLAELDARPSQLDAVVCGTGPGPYTGLRVGMATAAAFGDALGVPVYGVCSLDGIAGAAAHQGALLVVTDARRKEVYWARYEDGHRTEGPGVVRPAELDPGLSTAVAGSRVHATLFARPVLAPESPDPASLVTVVAPDLLAGVTPESLVPLYLRRPDAVATSARSMVVQS